MNRILRMVCAAAVGMVLFSACAEQETVSYTENEKIALRAWMELHHPELVANYQSDGAYYVDVLERGSLDAKPINDTATWVRFTFTGRNLGGDIVLSRSEIESRQVGTYTKYTHYVPYFKFYAGDRNTSLLEGTYLAMRNKLTLGKEYAAQHNLPAEIEMRYGTKVTLYMPSTVVGVDGMGGTGGYEGQAGYELKSGYPFVVTMEITDTVRNPLQREGVDVDAFARQNGGVLPVVPKPSNPKQMQANGLMQWTPANDTIPHIYIKHSFKPTEKFIYSSAYKSIYAPYADFAKLEQDICDTLVNRFGVYDPSQVTEDKVTLKGAAKIWYIARLLDGFIIDSNIPGVRQLVFGEKTSQGKPMDYTPESGGAIEAFYYAIPHLRYGQWAGLVTSSANAYGSQGKPGKTTTSGSSSNNYDYLNYYNSMNSYYGANNYYGGYGGYYGGYMGGQYENYNVPTTPKVTTTTTSTEIQPYAPLLFELYIEKKK